MSDLDLFDGNGSHADMRNKTNTALNTLNVDKVEKVAGKGLSTEDFTTDEKNKLNGIEDGATADQSAVEIKTAYESNSDTNVFTDAEKAKLAGIRDSKATSGDDVSELVPFITPATVANQFSIPATVKYIDGLRVVIPETLITLPAAPDGLDKLDGTGRYADLAAAITAGGTGLTQSVITRQDVVVYDVNQAKYSVHQGLREYSGMVDAMTAFSYTQDAKDKTLWRDGSGSLFVMVCHLQRLNQGLYDPRYNGNGCKKASDSLFWYNTAVSFTSSADCFDPAKLLTASGTIASGISGRPPVWSVKYHDGIVSEQTHDNRVSCNRKPESDMLIDAARDIEADDIRGKESVPFTKPITLGTGTDANKARQWFYTSNLGKFGNRFALYLDATASGVELGDIVSFYDSTSGYVFSGEVEDIVGTAFVYASSRFGTDIPLGYHGTGNQVDSLHTNYLSSQFETLPYQDIVGDPARIAATFPYGVYGSWITTIPDNLTGLFPCNRKAISPAGNSAYHTLDNGVTWTAYISTLGIAAITNEAGLSGLGQVEGVNIVVYETKANPLTLVNNSKVVGGISTASALQHHTDTLVSHLIGKVATGNTAKDRIQGLHLDGYSIDENGLLSETNEYQPTHRVIDLLNGNSPAAKVFYRLAIRDSQYYLQLCAKEMSWDVTLDDGAEFTDRTGTTSETYTGGEYYHVLGGKQSGYWYCLLTVTDSLDTGYWSEVDGYLINASGIQVFKRWDGNGFGDNEKFPIHDGEATEPDENGNTVISVLKEVALPHFTGEDE